MTPSKPHRAGQRLRGTLVLGLAVGLTTLSNGGNAKVSSVPPTVSPADRWNFADIADLFLAAPIVARARIVEAIPVKDSQAAPSRAGTIRYYLVADVVTLIRGTDGIAPRIAWIADVPIDLRGKVPKLKRTEVIVAALPVPGRAAEVRLAARDAMVPWSAAFEARVRGIVASGLATGAPPRVTGIASAFHSRGNLPGEGETQIFLTTERAQPVSLSVLRRPGQAPRWAVALGEIVDEAARAPSRDTLGWYRLACALPPTLPQTAIDDLSPDDAAAARDDYAFVIGALGPCTRTRGSSAR